MAIDQSVEKAVNIPGVIEVRIQKLAQLFNSLDPSPFHERDLDHDAEEYIVGWARELPSDAPLRIVIHLPEEAARDAQARDLPSALANYFTERAQFEQRELNELFRVGRRYLFVGSTALVICLLGSQLARRTLGDGPLVTIMAESLVFFGWVANWKPIETFLYDWWPMKRRRDLFRRLAQAKVDLEQIPSKKS
ncbi:MAG TPA: hypothetical protein PKE16_03500 [Hyphomicrobium sp.]|nr:hypothetical protein [Hyphomicrobium sp.]